VRLFFPNITWTYNGFDRLKSYPIFCSRLWEWYLSECLISEQSGLSIKFLSRSNSDNFYGNTTRSELYHLIAEYCHLQNDKAILVLFGWLAERWIVNPSGFWVFNRYIFFESGCCGLLQYRDLLYEPGDCSSKYHRIIPLTNFSKGKSRWYWMCWFEVPMSISRLWGSVCEMSPAS
jgi:hypothetical protein